MSMEHYENEEMLGKMIRSYPQSNRKITVVVQAFSIDDHEAQDNDQAQTVFLSPYGLEFQGNKAFAAGELLKIHIPIPDYWRRKQRYVSYKRIDVPTSLHLLGKVVVCQEKGKQGRRKLVLVETVNIDKIDEEILKEYLGEERHARSRGQCIGMGE